MGQRLHRRRKRFDVDAARIRQRDKIFGVHQILTVEGAGGVVTKYRSQRVDFQIHTDSGETVNVRGSTLPSTVASTTPVTDW